MVEFAGWQMPVWYRSLLDEHQSVRSAAGLFDVSHMGEIEIEGPGAERFCARWFANDARALRVGRAQYSLIPNAHGGVVDDVIVYRLGRERFLVCVNAANTAKDFAWLCAEPREDCRVEDVSERYALIAVQGPKARAIVGSLASDLQSLARFDCREQTIAGATVLAACTGYTGEDGFEIFVAEDRAGALWHALTAAGEPAGLVPVGLGARDTLRLEAGLPLYGHELGEDISPYEAGLGWVVKLNRPEMTGYAALVSEAAGPKRRLIGLTVEGGIARAGCPVLASEIEIGMVTSGSHCPTMRKAMALALVDGGARLEDLSVVVRGSRKPASVTAVPFYVRDPRVG
jgi:aminomethyltransferase